MLTMHLGLRLLNIFFKHIIIIIYDTLAKNPGGRILTCGYVDYKKHVNLTSACFSVGSCTDECNECNGCVMVHAITPICGQNLTRDKISLTMKIMLSLSCKSVVKNKPLS